MLTSALDVAIVVSMVFVRANGDVMMGKPEFKCKELHEDAVARDQAWARIAQLHLYAIWMYTFNLNIWNRFWVAPNAAAWMDKKSELELDHNTYSIHYTCNTLSSIPDHPLHIAWHLIASRYSFALDTSP